MFLILYVGYKNVAIFKQLGKSKKSFYNYLSLVIFLIPGFVNEDGTPVDPDNLPDPGPTPDLGPGPAPWTTNTPPVVCQKSQTEVQGLRSVCQGALIFTEDFNKANLDKLNQWDPEVMLPRGPVNGYFCKFFRRQSIF